MALAGEGAAHAKCGARTEWRITPTPGTALTERGWILIEADIAGPIAAQQCMAAFDSPLALKGVDHDVPLEVAFVSNGIPVGGGVSGMQWLLRPKHPLRVGQQYALAIANQRFEWTAEPATSVNLRWTGPPQEAARDYARLPCGPESHLWIQAPLTIHNALMRFRATPVHGGEKREHIVRVKDGRIEVGRNMCYGGVDLKAGGEYQLELWALHPDGREVAAPQALRIRAPNNDDPKPLWLAELLAPAHEDGSPLSTFGILVLTCAAVGALGLLLRRAFKSRLPPRTS